MNFIFFYFVFIFGKHIKCMITKKPSGQCRLVRLNHSGCISSRLKCHRRRRPMWCTQHGDRLRTGFKWHGQKLVRTVVVVVVVVVTQRVRHRIDHVSYVYIFICVCVAVGRLIEFVPHQRVVGKFVQFWLQRLWQRNNFKINWFFISS